MYSFVYDALQLSLPSTAYGFGLLVLSDACHLRERAPCMLAPVPGWQATDSSHKTTAHLHSTDIWNSMQAVKHLMIIRS